MKCDGKAWSGEISGLFIHLLHLCGHGHGLLRPRGGVLRLLRLSLPGSTRGLATWPKPGSGLEIHDNYEEDSKRSKKRG